MTYSTNINIDHSEIIFLLSSGIELPESLLKKLNSAYSYTSMLEENREWHNDIETSDIVAVLMADDLISYTPFINNDVGRKQIQAILEFCETNKINKCHIRVIHNVTYDRNNWPRDNIYLIIRETGEYRRHDVCSRELDGKIQWYVCKYYSSYNKFYDTDVLKLKGE